MNENSKYGSDPVKSVSADGTYFVYCAGAKESNKTSIYKKALKL